ncbi:MAG: hypothetical protein AB8B49_00545 [Nitratireductor sp.]
MLHTSNTQKDMAHVARQSSQTIIGLSSLTDQQFKKIHIQSLAEKVIISSASLCIISAVTFFSVSSIL